MKTFKDLKFKNKNGGKGGKFGFQARLDFENKYGVSVIKGHGAYSNNDKPYELAVFLGGSLNYDTDITNDVLGYLDEDEVTDLMKQVQELK